MLTTLKIQGMHCASCKALIEDVVNEIPGVTSCVVDIVNNTARVEHDDSVNQETIQRAIEDVGSYKVSLV